MLTENKENHEKAIVEYLKIIEEMQMKVDELRRKNVESDCPICMEEYNSDERIKCASKGCGHRMCMSCFEEILRNKNQSVRKCPFCNKKVQPNQILKLY